MLTAKEPAATALPRLWILAAQTEGDIGRACWRLRFGWPPAPRCGGAGPAAQLVQIAGLPPEQLRRMQVVQGGDALLALDTVTGSLGSESSAGQMLQAMGHLAGHHGLVLDADVLGVHLHWGAFALDLWAMDRPRLSPEPWSPHQVRVSVLA